MGTEPEAAGEADPADAGNRIEGHLGRRRQYSTTSHEQEKAGEERLLEIGVFVSSLLNQLLACLSQIYTWFHNDKNADLILAVSAIAAAFAAYFAARTPDGARTLRFPWLAPQ
jgi:hypothetical protein